MEKKLQKIYRTYYSLIVQGFWQAHYQIFPRIFWKEFVEINVNINMMIKNVKHLELNISIVTIFLNTPILKII